MISSSSGQPPEIPALIRKYLCHFLHGLFVINKDQFIDRKIKQIFSHYFLSYLQSDPNSSTNPFVLLVSPAFYETPNKYDCDVFLRVLDIISKQQLMIDESIPNVNKVLNFLHMLSSRVKYYYLILEATPILLGPLLSLFLRMGPPPSTQNCVVIIKKIFRKLFEANKSHADELPHSKLMPVIQEYLVSNLLNNKVK
ncbi:PREDICTED: uncharacterized protein LOC109593154 [Amphimedon queenslandica]|uniref:MMS22-like C-terminal domain-containing protein n=1 Tax=Amphimedon queenslandica TaxID=400682 RepID=A0AAN0K310_AMPQE|nr:PREDICTED: uncharacterized protein LOC109593154 [Amphimedon queenslandica]|eukprot:XP_019863928.1 PREDICTED: uncharacterized protein LOC109593154 [Amphimedon queenslandica]